MNETAHLGTACLRRFRAGTAEMSVWPDAFFLWIGNRVHARQRADAEGLRLALGVIERTVPACVLADWIEDHPIRNCGSISTTEAAEWLRNLEDTE